MPPYYVCTHVVVGKTHESRKNYTHEGRIWLDIVLVGSIQVLSPSARENTSAHSYNIQPHSTFTGVIIYIYLSIIIHDY